MNKNIKIINDYTKVFNCVIFIITILRLTITADVHYWYICCSNKEYQYLIDVQNILELKSKFKSIQMLNSFFWFINKYT